mgnify:FL=1
MFYIRSNISTIIRVYDMSNATHTIASRTVGIADRLVV